MIGRRGVPCHPVTFSAKVCARRSEKKSLRPAAHFFRAYGTPAALNSAQEVRLFSRLGRAAPPLDFWAADGEVKVIQVMKSVVPNPQTSSMMPPEKKLVLFVSVRQCVHIVARFLVNKPL